MLYIRADGNAEIGTGHIMRCLSIANEVRKSGGDCTFITADTQMKPLLDEQGFSFICLNSVWNNLDIETGKMERIIHERKIGRLLVDSYFVTPDYLERLHKRTYLIYIDDLDLFTYPCSKLINYNIYAGQFDYPNRYPDTELLLGPKYVPLREEFRGLPFRAPRETAESVLVTTGGSDSYNIAGQLVERAKRCQKTTHLHFHIVAGRLNQNLSSLQALAGVYPGVVVHHNVHNISQLMRSCDIAVSAGGSTLYELCACGIPAIIFAMADNQLRVVSSFGEGYMLGCGDYRDDGDACLSRLIEGIAALEGDWEARLKMSKKSWELVYGDGVGQLYDRALLDEFA